MKKKKKITKAELKRKEKKKARAQYNKDLLDWKIVIKERDNYTCQICKNNVRNKKHNCHAHHILDKKNYKGLSLDIINGITLCYRDHKVGKHSPHMNALWFYKWLKENKTEQFNYLIKYI